MECGWTKEYIIDNLTEKQLVKYCEFIHAQKMKEERMHAISILRAVGTAFGTMPLSDFKEYLKSLEGKKETPEEFNAKLDEAKNKGLNIEDA